MIFLGNLMLISGTNYQVGMVHNMPLDTVNGIKDTNGNLLTQEQLNQIGVLVDSIPEPNPPTGQQVSIMFVDKSTNTITYTYTDIQKTQEEITQEQVNNLGQQLAQEKLSNIQKDTIVNGLGQQLTDIKLQVIKLQGGTK